MGDSRSWIGDDVKYYAKEEAREDAIPQDIELIAAIAVVRNRLAADKSPNSYYNTWQANIAMTMHDEYYRRIDELRNAEDTGQVLHSIFNSAATKFLDLFIDTNNPQN